MTANTPKKRSPNAQSGNRNAVSDKEVRQESSKAADQALAAQQKATELKDAAAGAGDPEERQKLMEQAIDEQIKAESFGKTARYLRSGTFQGMAVGTGLGVAPGATLGALTGTLVGGVTSTITGGLGGGIGAAAGALHGPFWNLGEIAGKGIQKVTGNLPGWNASEEQKKTLEKMIGQINEEDMPSKDDLQRMKKDAGNGQQSSWTGRATSGMPSLPSMADSNNTKTMTPNANDHSNIKPSHKPKETRQNGGASKPQDRRSSRTSQSGGVAKPDEKNRKKPRKLEVKSDNNNETSQSSARDAKRKPRKLQTRSHNENAVPPQSPTAKKAPRKLERRSA